MSDQHRSSKRKRARPNFYIAGLSTQVDQEPTLLIREENNKNSSSSSSSSPSSKNKTSKTETAAASVTLSTKRNTKQKQCIVSQNNDPTTDKKKSNSNGNSADCFSCGHSIKNGQCKCITSKTIYKSVSRNNRRIMNDTICQRCCNKCNEKLMMAKQKKKEKKLTTTLQSSSLSSARTAPSQVGKLATTACYKTVVENEKYHIGDSAVVCDEQNTGEQNEEATVPSHHGRLLSPKQKLQGEQRRQRQQRRRQQIDTFLMSQRNRQIRKVDHMSKYNDNFTIRTSINSTNDRKSSQEQQQQRQVLSKRSRIRTKFFIHNDDSNGLSSTKIRVAKTSMSGNTNGNNISHQESAAMKSTNNEKYQAVCRGGNPQQDAVTKECSVADNKRNKKGIYIDERVAKAFGKRIYFGSVTNHFADDNGDEKNVFTANEIGGLWRIAYDDGDEEDLDLKEVTSAMILYKKIHKNEKEEAKSGNQSVVKKDSQSTLSLQIPQHTLPSGPSSESASFLETAPLLPQQAPPQPSQPSTQQQNGKKKKRKKRRIRVIPLALRRYEYQRKKKCSNATTAKSDEAQSKNYVEKKESSLLENKLSPSAPKRISLATTADDNSNCSKNGRNEIITPSSQRQQKKKERGKPICLSTEAKSMGRAKTCSSATIANSTAPAISNATCSEKDEDQTQNTTGPARQICKISRNKEGKKNMKDNEVCHQEGAGSSQKILEPASSRGKTKEEHVEESAEDDKYPTADTLIADVLHDNHEHLLDTNDTDEIATLANLGNRNEYEDRNEISEKAGSKELKQSESVSTGNDGNEMEKKPKKKRGRPKKNEVIKQMSSKEKSKKRDSKFDAGSCSRKPKRKRLKLATRWKQKRSKIDYIDDDDYNEHNNSGIDDSNDDLYDDENCHERIGMNPARGNTKQLVAKPSKARKQKHNNKDNYLFLDMNHNRGRPKSSKTNRRPARGWKKTNFLACGKCMGCLHTKNCGRCFPCLDMIEFGGDGKSKQPCIERKCITPVPRSATVKVSGDDTTKDGMDATAEKASNGSTEKDGKSRDNTNVTSLPVQVDGKIHRHKAVNGVDTQEASDIESLSDRGSLFLDDMSDMEFDDTGEIGEICMQQLSKHINNNTMNYSTSRKDVPAADFCFRNTATLTISERDEDVERLGQDEEAGDAACSDSTNPSKSTTKENLDNFEACSMEEEVLSDGINKRNVAITDNYNDGVAFTSNAVSVYLAPREVDEKAGKIDGMAKVVQPPLGTQATAAEIVRSLREKERAQLASLTDDDEDDDSNCSSEDSFGNLMALPPQVSQSFF